MAILMFPPEIGVATVPSTVAVRGELCLEERFALLPGIIARAGRKLGRGAPRLSHPSMIPANELPSLDTITQLLFGLNRLANLTHPMFKPGRNESWVARSGIVGWVGCG